MKKIYWPPSKFSPLTRGDAKGRGVCHTRTCYRENPPYHAKNLNHKNFRNHQQNRHHYHIQSWDSHRKNSPDQISSLTSRTTYRRRLSLRWSRWDDTDAIDRIQAHIQRPRQWISHHRDIKKTPSENWKSFVKITNFLNQVV